MHFCKRGKGTAALFVLLWFMGCATAGMNPSEKPEEHVYMNTEQKTALIQVLRRHIKPDMYVSPDIPARKKTNATQACGISGQEEILSLVDGSFFGSAKECLIVGTSGIYFRNGWLADSPGRIFIPYKDFVNMDIRSGDWLSVKVIIGNKGFENSGSMMRDDLVKLLKDVQMYALVNGIGVHPSGDYSKTGKAVWRSQDDLWKSVKQSIQKGNTKDLDDFIKKGVGVNAVFGRDATMLMYAAQEGKKDVVEFLIQNGADINKATAEGNTALHVAVVSGKPAIVEILTAHGADVDAQSDAGVTAMILATQNGFDEIYKHLAKLSKSQDPLKNLQRTPVDYEEELSKFKEFIEPFTFEEMRKASKEKHVPQKIKSSRYGRQFDYAPEDVAFQYRMERDANRNYYSDYKVGDITFSQKAIHKDGDSEQTYLVINSLEASGQPSISRVEVYVDKAFHGFDRQTKQEPVLKKYLLWAPTEDASFPTGFRRIGIYQDETMYIFVKAPDGQWNRQKYFVEPRVE